MGRTQVLGMAGSVYQEHLLEVKDVLNMVGIRSVKELLKGGGPAGFRAASEKFSRLRGFSRVYATVYATQKRGSRIQSRVQSRIQSRIQFAQKLYTRPAKIPTVYATFLPIF